MPLGSSRTGRPRHAERPRSLPFLQWSKNQDLVRWCTFGLIAITLSSVQMYLGPARLLRPGLVLLVLPYAALLLNSRLVRWENVTATWFTKGIAAFVVLIVGSGVFGLSLGTTVRLLTQSYLTNLAFFVLLVLSLRNVRDLGFLMWGYQAGVGLVVILAFTVLGSDVTQTGLNRLSGGMGMFDANDLGMIALIALPLALLFFGTSGTRGKIASLGLLAGIPAMIAFTGSRGAMVGLVIVGPVMLFSMKNVAGWRRIGLALGVTAGLALAAPAGYWDQMKTLLNPTEDYNVSSEYGRWPLTKRGFGYMMQYPVFGVGAGNFGRAEGTISPIIRSRLSRGLSVEWLAPHNTYVEVGAELGVIALGIWLSLLYAGTIGLMKLRRRLPEAWEHQNAERRFLRQACLYLPMSFLAFAVTSMFLSHAYSVIPLMLIAFMVGIRVLVAREVRIDMGHGPHQGAIVQASGRRGRLPGYAV